MDRKHTVALVAAILFAGLGHIILGYWKRGVMIIITLFVIGFIGGIFMGYYILLFGLPIYTWQLYDLRKLMKK